MKNHDPLLDLLLKSARPDAPPDDSLPPGFATRIAARWAAGDEPETLLARLWERLCLRAAVAGVVLAAATLSASMCWPADASAREAREAADLELMLGLR